MDQSLQNGLQTFLLDVRSPDSIFFSGQARAFSSVNNMGPFDVLAFHENFVSTIKDKVVVISESGQKKELKIGFGILKVFNNRVNVFLGFETKLP